MTPERITRPLAFPLHRLDCEQLNEFCAAGYPPWQNVRLARAGAPQACRRRFNKAAQGRY